MSVAERDPQSVSLDVLVLRHGAIPEGALSALLHDVLSTIIHLHAAGMIHNDIDPRSFFLSTTSGDLKVLHCRASSSRRCCHLLRTSVLLTVAI